MIAKIKIVCYDDSVKQPGYGMRFPHSMEDPGYSNDPDNEVCMTVENTIRLFRCKRQPIEKPFEYFDQQR